MNAKKLALLSFSQLIVALDYNIVYVALPDIGRELDFSAQTLQWVVSGYAVGFGGFLLLGGRAVDRLGARRMFILGLTLYGISSLAGGLAADPGLLVAARVIQGLGGALLTPATLALIYSGFAEGPMRNRALGAWGTAGSAGLAAGALLGGVLTAAAGWQWVFYVNVPLTLIAIVAASRLLPPDPSRERGSFDVLGALLATAGSTLMVLGLVSGPEAGWVTPRGLGSMVVGIVLIGAFLLVEARSSEPLAPPRLLGNRNLATSMLVILFFQSALGGGYYLFTMYLQPVLGYSALQAGLAFLPLTLLSMVSAARLAPALLGRWGVRTTLVVGMLGSGIGMVVLYAGMSAGGSFWALVPGTVIWGLSGGFTFVAMFAAAGSGVALTEQGVASGLATTAQQIGGAIGLAVIIAVANAGAPGVDGLRTAGWVAAAASIAGALIALTLKRQPTAAAQEATTSPEGITR
ncbi:drug resistance transporter, EmrB/QacA subfamily [Streptosporangium subroseum]|uniref:Drug resistance transporter, EmrB/QacA subfamily n=1 Tax=Streptosporangium subroseum TaxID=106412 RepID=A0A239PBX5_9ACTN|nr:MFS transporter [Streptosporangium subroseum]SNT64432.1 drug resistance transporter, EmrB/QacA subfamily [Streptosporangium subroseum]